MLVMTPSDVIGMPILREDVSADAAFRKAVPLFAITASVVAFGRPCLQLDAIVQSPKEAFPQKVVCAGEARQKSKETASAIARTN